MRKERGKKNWAVEEDETVMDEIIVWKTLGKDYKPLREI